MFSGKTEQPPAPLSCLQLTHGQVFKIDKLGYFLNDLICILLSTVQRASVALIPGPFGCRALLVFIFVM